MSLWPNREERLQLEKVRDLVGYAENARIVELSLLATDENGFFDKMVFAQLIVEEFSDECRRVARVWRERANLYGEECWTVAAVDRLATSCALAGMKRLGVEKPRKKRVKNAA